MIKRLLVVSPLDVLGSRNSRTHHLVRHLSSHFDQTFSISRTNITHKSLREKLEAFFRIRTHAVREGTITWIGLTPLGSVRHGLGHHLLGIKKQTVLRGRIRSWLRRMLNFFGLFLEFGIVPSLALAFIVRINTKTDIFIGEGPWEVVFGIFLRMLGKTRTIIYDDIDYAPGFLPDGPRRKFIAALECYAIRHADVIVTVSERLERLRRKQRAQRLFIIPNGVDREKFMVASSLRKKKDRRRSTLIYIGYLGAWAGVDIVLDAGAIVYKKMRELRVILLGHGNPEDILLLRERIHALGIKDIVDMRGEVAYDDLPAHLAEADIGLAMFRTLDLTKYAFPLKVVEYMAAGLPVVTTEDTEAADLVKRTDTGIAVPFDATAIAQAVIEILHDTEGYQRYSENALSCSKRYDWEKLMEKYYYLINHSYKTWIYSEGNDVPGP